MSLLGKFIVAAIIGAAATVVMLPMLVMGTVFSVYLIGGIITGAMNYPAVFLSGGVYLFSFWVYMSVTALFKD